MTLSEVCSKTSINEIMHYQLFWLRNNVQAYTVFRRFDRQLLTDGAV